jgi:hypothetical protein
MISYNIKIKIFRSTIISFPTSNLATSSFKAKRVPSIVFYPTHKFDEKMYMLKIRTSYNFLLEGFAIFMRFVLYPGTLVSHSRIIHKISGSNIQIHASHFLK